MPSHDLQLYLADVCRYEPLSPQENLAFVMATRYGHAHARRAARKVAVMHNMRLVANIAKRYRYQGLPYEDLCEYGVAGLLEAIDKFDWNRDVRFVTYAHVAIEHTIQRDLFQTSEMIRVPVHHQQTEWLFKRAREEMAAATGREPTAEQVLGETGIDPEIYDAIRTARSSVSLDSEVTTGTEGEGGATLQDLLPDRETNVERNAAVAELWRTVLECVEQTAVIDERIPTIFRQYYLEGLTFRDIGPQLGISYERARQLRNLGMELIKSRLEASDLSEVWQTHDCRIDKLPEGVAMSL